jgi:hypothetical protein
MDGEYEELRLHRGGRDGGEVGGCGSSSGGVVVVG